MSEDIRIDSIFKNEEGFTTVGFALVILLVISLVFAGANYAHNQSQASEIQAVADAAALAGANVVARYVTIASVLDAVVLSLGLCGMTCLAIGLVVGAIPQLAQFSPPIINAAKQILTMRDNFGRSVYEGLAKLEKGLPYLVAANSMALIKENSSQDLSYVGLALPFPKDGTDSSFEIIEDLKDEASSMEDASEQVKELAKEAEKYKEQSNEELKAAWMADCGDEPYSMYERGLHKAHLSGALNPYYPSFDTWSIETGLNRAKNYYNARITIERPEGQSLEEQVKSTSRYEFYMLASKLCSQSNVSRDQEGYLTVELEELPKNTETMKSSYIYSESKWPISVEGDYKTLHFSQTCPGFTGNFIGNGSLAGLDSGAYVICNQCNFSIKSIGKVPQASTAISNGFEYHYKKYREAAYAYADAYNKYLEKEKAAKEASEQGSDAFEKALDKLKKKRPKITPPGRFGVVSVVVDAKEKEAQSALVNALSTGAKLPARAAISGAVLAPESSDKDRNILSEFFEGIKAQAPNDIGFFLGDSLFDILGKILQSYADGFSEASLSNFFEEQTSLMGSSNSISNWIVNAITEILDDFGLTPPYLRLKKPVLTNTVNIFEQANADGAVQVRHFIDSLPPEAYMNEPDKLAQYFLDTAESSFSDKTVNIGELLFPNSSQGIPIEIELE